MPLDSNSYKKLLKSSQNAKDFKVSAPAPVAFRSIQELVSSETDTYQEHVHEFCEVIAPSNGVYKCLLNGEALSVSPGSFVFIQYEDLHSDVFQKGSTFASLSFRLDDPRMRRVFSSAATGCRRLFPLSKPPALSLFWNELKAESGSGQAALGALEGLCQAFFWKFIESVPRELLSENFKKALNDESFQRRVQAVFEESLGGVLDIGLLASRLGVSERKLYDLFQESFGTSPNRAFTDFKMREAAKLLAAGDLKVAEVAKRLGFDDPFHFSRAFKRTTGASPSSCKPPATSTE